MFNILNLIFGSPEKQLRDHTKNVCKTMLNSSNSFYEYSKKKGISIKSYADLAFMALKTRPGWEKNSNNQFIFKNQYIINIKKEYSVADVSLLVILYELEHHIKNELNQPVSQSTLEIVLDEFKIFFNGSISDDKIHQIIKDWK